MAKTVREFENVVEIEGIVQEVDIEIGKEYEDAQGNDNQTIRGRVDILVNEDVHTVTVRANKLNKEGKESSLFKGIQTIMDDYVSIKDVGVENKDKADKVRITSGQLGLNEYVGQDGEIASFPQISSNFIHRLKSSDDFNPKAEFRVEMAVAHTKAEKVKDEETGRAILKGNVVGYQGRTFPFELVVTSGKAADYVIDNYEKDTIVTVQGEIINKTEIKKKVTESAFGDDMVEETRRTIREFLVTRGTEPIDDEDHEKYVDPKIIKKGLKERDERHEDMKKRKAENGSNGGNSGGSRAKNKKNENPFSEENINKPIDVNEDDLPF